MSETNQSAFEKKKRDFQIELVCYYFFFFLRNFHSLKIKIAICYNNIISRGRKSFHAKRVFTTNDGVRKNRIFDTDTHLSIL